MEYKTAEEIVGLGIEEGLLRVREDKVEYVSIGKTYKITDPEELVRASYYTELVTKYKYPKGRIDLEVVVPRREPKDKADIVVYADDEKKKPYIVVECKKDGIPQSEIKQAIEQVFGNANSLGSKHAILVAGNVRIAFDVANFPPMEREKNAIADIPVRYGKVIKFKYKKGDKEWDLREVTRNELLAKFQQCHDTLWEGGKRNPAEAFDEMSKLMFCKVHDERFLTKKGETYSFQVGTHEAIKEVADRVKKIYEDAQRRDPDVFVDPIKAENAILYGVVEILQGISLSKTDLDAKGVAFEHFLGAVFRGEMGQYFTPRPIVEFMVSFLEPTVNDFVIDPACGSGGFLIYSLEKVRKYLDESLEPEDARDRWKDFGLKQVFGVEINSQLARVSMMNMIIHEDGHTNIENHDALDDVTKFVRYSARFDIRLGKFSLLLTNPPFGAFVREREKAYFNKYEFGSKTKKRNRQNTEILFIERCLDFLKPGGRMGIVLPDGILTNSTLQYVRDFITERAQVIGVVSLPQTAFTHYGSGVKASLVFLRKKKDREKLPENYPIFMAVAEHIGYDATGRADKNEFPDILEAWKKFRKENKLNFFHNAPLCFAVGRGETEERLDPNPYNPVRRETIKKIKSSKFPVLPLIPDVVEVRREIVTSNIRNLPYIGLENIESETGIFIPSKEEKKSFGSAFEFKKGDILFPKLRPYLNKVYLAEFDGVCSTEFHVLDVEKCNNFYLFTFLNSKLVVNQTSFLMTGDTLPRLQTDDIEKLLVPLPPRPIQDRIAKIMDEAYRQKREKEQEAEMLLNSFEDLLFEKTRLKLSESTQRKIFVVYVNELEGALNPERYANKIAFDDNFNWKRIDKVGDVVRETFTPAKSNPEEHFSLLRIDDLESNPQKAVIREVHGIDINGIIAKVQTNDVLIARLGPTIENKKFILAPSSNKPLIASTEFICLRCNSDNNFLFVLSVLKTDFYKNLMIQKSRGATPSRRRLSHEDFAEMPLPEIDIEIQNQIAEEVKSRMQRAEQLKQDAKKILAKAKGKAEKMILGKDND